MMSRDEAELQQAVTDAKDAFERARALARQLAESAADLTFVHPDGTTAPQQAVRVEQTVSQAYDDAMRSLSALVLNQPPAGAGKPPVSSVTKEYLALARQLFVERSWLTELLSSLSDAVIATDEEGRVRFLNPVARTLTGWEPEPGGNPIEEVYRLSTPAGEPVETYQLREALDSTTPTGKTRYRLQSRTGSETDIEESSAPILEADRLAGAVTVFLDITERLRLEREEAERREELEDQVQTTEETLERTRSEFHGFSGHLMKAQEEERRLVARELHSELSDRAAMAGFEAGRIEQLLPQLEGEVQERVRAMHAHIQELTSRLNGMANRLYPSILEDIGLQAAVRSLAGEFRNAGLEVRVTIRDLPAEVPIEIATALYRIIQDALSNVHLHGEGAAARLTLAAVGNEIRLTVEDSGPGFDVTTAQAKGGLGLWSIQERARLVGGNLLIRTKPGEGTLLLVRVPAK